MNNSSKSISANEINKYAYCPYQWYYERFYGAAYLRRAYKERNEELGLTDTVFSNFKKGLDYHAGYEAGSKGMGRLAKLIVLFAALFGAFCAFYYYYFYMQV